MKQHQQRSVSIASQLSTDERHLHDYASRFKVLSPSSNRASLDSFIPSGCTWEQPLRADQGSVSCFRIPHHVPVALMIALPDRFFADVDNISHMNNSATHLSYKAFLAFFSEKHALTEHDLVIGAYFTYGWMPTILELRGSLRELVDIANMVKQSRVITDAQFRAVAFAINGSVVGASKLLHFINPCDHAIWDSRVYRYLHQQEPYQYRLEAPDVYWTYLKELEALAMDKRFADAKKTVENVTGYPVSNKRAAEIVMYYNGGG